MSNTKKIKHILIILFLIGSILGSMFLTPVNNNFPVKATWWNGSWNEAVLLTIDSSYINTSLENFPLLVIINSTVGALCDGGDSIRFLDGDNSTEYKYEIETWNGAGNSYVWVKIPYISSSSNTEFLMYYNNSGASDNQDPTNVWDAYYECVYHLNDPSGNINDSTSNGNIGIQGGESASNFTYSQTGQIGHAIKFDGVSANFSSVLPKADISHTNGFFEYWIKPDVTNKFGIVLGNEYTGDNRFYLGVTNTNGYRAGWGTQTETAGTPATHWSYVAHRSNTSNVLHMFVNDSVSSTIATTSANFNTGDSDIFIGTGIDHDNDFWAFDGLIDEVRVSSIKRNESYRIASFHSMNHTDGFLTMGQNISQLPPPTNVLATTTTYTNIDLSWTKATGSTHTVIVRKTTGYPSSITDGTLIYNDTGSAHSDSGLTPYGTYYYGVWGFDSGSSDFSSRADALNYTGCDNPTSLTRTIVGNNLNISWTNGVRAESTRVVRKIGSYPTSPADGTAVQNTSADYYNATFVSSYYFTLYSYDNATGLFSSGADLVWGLLTVNCYDVETNNSLIFDLFITDAEGDDTFYQTGCTNPTYVDVQSLPLGDAISIKVSADSSYGNTTEINTGYGVTENQTITYIALGREPINKANTNVTCRNTTSGGHYYPSFTLTGDLITIMPHASSEFNRVDINYSYRAYADRFYNRDFQAGHFYALNAYLPEIQETNTRLYTVQVLGPQGEFTSPPINDARLVFKRYLPFISAYAPISSVHTDANGQKSIFLIPDEVYRVNITKDGYVSTDVEVIPVDSDDPADRVIRLRIERNITTPPRVHAFDSFISYTAVMTSAGYLKDGNITITYADSNSTTQNTTIYVYEVYNGTMTLKNSSFNSSQSFSYVVHNINTTRTHYAFLHYNNTNTFEVTSPLLRQIFPVEIFGQEATKRNLNNLIVGLLGPFKMNDVTILWGNVIAIVIPIICLIGVSAFDKGAGILACGLSMGLIQAIFALKFTDALNPLFIALTPAVFAIFIIYVFASNREEDI